MTELDITVNDGLRLSELYGELAKLQYKLDNIGLVIDEQKLKATILLLVIAALAGLMLLVVISVASSDRPSKREKAAIVAILAAYAVAIAAIWCFWMGHIDTYAVYNLECDMSRVQGEIDGILARYGGGGA